MIENLTYPTFLQKVNVEGVEILNRETMLFWATLLRGYGARETAFIRKSDGTIWLCVPGTDIDALITGADTHVSMVRDIGQIRFEGIDELGVVVSGSMDQTIREVRDERAHTVLLLKRELGREARRVVSKE